jgi:hypothetical protein
MLDTDGTVSRAVRTVQQFRFPIRINSLAIVFSFRNPYLLALILLLTLVISRVSARALGPWNQPRKNSLRGLVRHVEAAFLVRNF